MFVMQMPESFKLGDTAICKVNGKPTALTWRSPQTLVIGTTDARHIVRTHIEDGMRVLICGDADGTEYGVEEVPGEGFIVFAKPEGSTS